jgi:hypothetical protein
MATGPSWRRAAALGLGLFAVYCANGREIGSGDTVPALLQPIAVLRGDGFALDRFRHLWPDGLPYMIAIQAIGAFHYPSSYNVGPRNIDLDQARLWSWRDGELARGLREGAHRWE